MSEKVEEAFARFRERAEKFGMATAPTTDGRIFMFKSEYLRQLVLSTNSPALKFGVRQQDGTIKDVYLGRDRLLMELEATTEPYILVLLTDQPVKN
jgi:hypothetical protein